MTQQELEGIFAQRRAEHEAKMRELQLQEATRAARTAPPSRSRTARSSASDSSTQPPMSP